MDIKCDKHKWIHPQTDDDKYVWTHLRICVKCGKTQSRGFLRWFDISASGFEGRWDASNCQYEQDLRDEVLRKELVEKFRGYSSTVKTEKEIREEIERVKSTNLRDYGDFRDVNWELHRINALKWVLGEKITVERKR